MGISADVKLSLFVVAMIYQQSCILVFDFHIQGFENNARIPVYWFQFGHQGDLAHKRCLFATCIPRNVHWFLVVFWASVPISCDCFHPFYLPISYRVTSPELKQSYPEIFGSINLMDTWKTNIIITANENKGQPLQYNTMSMCIYNGILMGSARKT